MTIETRDEALDKILTQKKPACPHCAKEMDLWEIPPVDFSDGLGWGVPFLYVCFNDECPLFTQGWDELMEQVGQRSSFRCMNYPGTETFELLPVFSSYGGSGQIVTDETEARKKEQEAAIKSGFSILADCYVNKDLVQILKMTLDGTEPTRVRIKAAEMMGDLSDTEAIDPLRNTKFANSNSRMRSRWLSQKFTNAASPESAHLCGNHKKQANICKHCKTSVAGE